MFVCVCAWVCSCPRFGQCVCVCVCVRHVHACRGVCVRVFATRAPGRRGRLRSRACVHGPRALVVCVHVWCVRVCIGGGATSHGLRSQQRESTSVCSSRGNARSPSAGCQPGGHPGRRAPAGRGCWPRGQGGRMLEHGVRTRAPLCHVRVWTRAPKHSPPLSPGAAAGTAHGDSIFPGSPSQPCFASLPAASRPAVRQAHRKVRGAGAARAVEQSVRRCSTSTAATRPMAAAAARGRGEGSRA